MVGHISESVLNIIETVKPKVRAGSISAQSFVVEVTCMGFQ